MKATQSSCTQKLPRIFLATLLISTPICHAAIKPSINPKALALWQQKVARNVWKTLKSKSLIQKEIDTTITKNKPSAKQLFTNLATATQKVPQKPAFLAAPLANLFWQRNQDSHVTKALEAFTQAQGLEETSKEIDRYGQVFGDELLKLDDKNIIDLTNLLTDLVNGELKNLGTKRYRATIKYAEVFLTKIKLLLIQKFKTQLDAANKLIVKAKNAEQSKLSLENDIKDAEQKIEELSKKIESSQVSIRNRLSILLFGWQEGSPQKLIDIATDPEFMKRLENPETNEIYRKKWDTIKNDTQLIDLFETRTKTISEKKDLEEKSNQLQQEHDQQEELWLEASYDLQELKTALEKNQVYVALNTLIMKIEELVQKQQNIAREQQAQSAEKPKQKQGSTIVIPRRKASTSAQEEEEEEGSWRTPGFSWQEDPQKIEELLKGNPK